MLRVKKANNLPEVSTFSVTTDEDIPYVFTLNDFTSHFTDPDADTLQNIKIVYEPISGSLMLNGSMLKAGDTVEYNDISKITYVPKENNSDLDQFSWNAFDGTDYALVRADVRIVINPVIDLPEILNFEETSLLYEFGNAEGPQITAGNVFDGDGDKIERAVISFKENYIRGEDLFYYDTLSLTDLTYVWEDSAGVLTIRGTQNTNIYTDAINFLRYVNTRPLSPTVTSRTIEIVLHDADTISIPYLRLVEFENTFVELDIPTGITPNLDGANDTWNIINIDKYEDAKVSVYSRTGQLLFESLGYQEEWDGTYDGDVLPPGPYYYAIHIAKFQRSYTGVISILR
jgi:gliding motility-associated-like protein